MSEPLKHAEKPPESAECRSEAKAAACWRLQAEGRYEEFRIRQKAYKNGDVTGEKMDRTGSFYAALDEFPPLEKPVDLKKAVPKKAKKGDLQAAVIWAAENYRAFKGLSEGSGVTAVQRGELKDEFLESAPSSLAASYLEFAIGNPAKFFGDTVKSALGKLDDGEERKRSKDERKMLDVIEKFVEAVKCPHCGENLW